MDQSPHLLRYNQKGKDIKKILLEYKDRPSIETIMNKRQPNFENPDFKSQEKVKGFLSSRG
jgi:hypothetical protein